MAVIDTVSGQSGIEITNEEKDGLRGVLSKYFPVENAAFSTIRDSFSTYVASSATLGNDEKEYKMQRYRKAKEQAAEGGSGALPETLLTCILNAPTDFIKAQMNTAGTETQKRLAALRAFVHQGEPSGQPEPVVEQTLPDGTPKEQLAALTEKVKVMQEKLSQIVYGQENAINTVASGYFEAEVMAMTAEKRKGPKAIFLFAGPPGVGKTFLAESFAEVMGMGTCIHRFDMSEYSDKEANIEFCGSDKVYKDGKEGNVTSFVQAHPKCILLFDEIEKAHIHVIHLFLQMLDSGFLRDNYTDKEVSFADAIIIMTTNAGKQLYEESDDLTFAGVTKKVILRALEQDVDPETNVPYFPAAICSRFAKGNVVMFNHITAHNLCAIAKKAIETRAADTKKKLGIDIQLDEQIYPTLLFSEGALADARTVSGRAGTFFNEEIFELLRLIHSENVAASIEGLERISIEVDVPTENEEIASLFAKKETYEVLTFAAEDVHAACVAAAPDTRFFCAQTVEQAKTLLHDHEINFVLVDVGFGMKQTEPYLNVEDIDSTARDFLRYIREYDAGMPVYLLQTPSYDLNPEERVSFLQQGVRDILPLSANESGFADVMKVINEKLHQQRSIVTLARANKVLRFETAQLLRDEGKTAVIKLFDFRLTTAVDAKDSENILSSVSKPDVKFDDVRGAKDAKAELQYFVQYLKDPRKFVKTGVDAPKGVLLYGPPGTGKTMLAKAMACASDVTFITAEGNQFLKKYVGEGPEAVHELFRTVRKYAPSILFIDEIDAIAKERRGGENSAGIEETLTAFLAEMDGFKNDAKKPVFVLAATNFDVNPGTEKSLDPALMRRFDRRIYIDLPEKEDRIGFIRDFVQTRPTFGISEAMIQNIAMRSTGMSLAELKSVLEMALRTTVRTGEDKVTDKCLEEAFETFHSGEARESSEESLKRTARHEAGHAFIYWYHGKTPTYVTVVSRGDYGGYMMQAEETRGVYTKDDLLHQIQTSLGGRAAELVYYGEKDGVSTGPSSDLASATRVAKGILCRYGMDTEFGLAVIDQQESQSSANAPLIREAVNRILYTELQAATQIIDANKAAIDALVDALLDKDHLGSEEIVKIFEEHATQSQA
ncbi:MAG: AAA family ATPase [Clostridia bacterium]|nr:AAA family ATPase [Clostridia bacterium]